MASSTPNPPRHGAPWNLVLPLAILAGAVGVYFLVNFAFATPPSPPSNSCSPCAAGMAIGAPVAVGGAGNRSYVMTFTPSSGFRWGEGSFGIAGSTGGQLTPTPSWFVVIYSPAPGGDSPIATYEFTGSTWLSGGTVLATSAQTIHLELGPTDLLGQSDVFTLYLSPTPTPGQGGSSTTLP